MGDDNFFFSSRRRHTRYWRDWSSDVCSSDLGRLTKDPELRFTPGTGKAVATFTLAVNRRFKSPGQPEADFLPIVVWGKTAENTANYVGKGSQVGVSGAIHTRSYEADRKSTRL